MVLALAAGQFLDLDDRNRATLDASLRVARLKSSAYSVEGPLAIGAALAGAAPDVGSSLAAYGRSLGEAFQLRDDLHDGDAAPGVTAADVDARIDAACAALGPIAGEVARDLCDVATSLRMGI
jgi:geranylgeranyl diphosphate synthase type I